MYLSGTCIAPSLLVFSMDRPGHACHRLGTHSALQDLLSLGEIGSLSMGTNQNGQACSSGGILRLGKGGTGPRPCKWQGKVGVFSLHRKDSKVFTHPPLPGRPTLGAGLTQIPTLKGFFRLAELLSAAVPSSCGL